jgi:hypothetical protein
VRSSELGWKIEGAHGGGAEGAEGFGCPSFRENFDGGNAVSAHLKGRNGRDSGGLIG